MTEATAPEAPLAEAEVKIRGRILVVDDEQRNRRLLRSLLESHGHEVTEAEDGEVALAQVAAWPPDVVLLDLMMPKLGGLEVCRRLRSDPKTEGLAILIVTALTERKDRLDAISAGANDFLTKPIDAPEVALRVRNALRAKQLTDRLQSSYERISRLEQLRENLTYMIVHDLRSPLTGIMGNLELACLKEEAEVSPELQLTLSRAMRSCQNMVDLVSSLLDVNRLEEGRMPLELGPCNLAETARVAMERLVIPEDLKSVRLEASANLGSVLCDPQLVERIIENLLGNALKHTPKGSEICISITMKEGQARVAISDNGPGVPVEFQEKIFEKFGQVEQRSGRRKYSTGLGLTFCKLAVEAHGGQIGLENGALRGSTFWFTLPPRIASATESELGNRVPGF